jgi:TatD DNase family protein
LQARFRTDIEELRKILRYEKVVAIGEIGLDNHHKRVPVELQISGLMAQLDLADEFCLPVIIHSRDALEQITPILDEWSSRRHSLENPPPFGVMHSFEGDLDAARHFIEIGFMISLAGPVTYKNAAVKIEIAREIPLDSLLLETDSPYLTPVPFRGQRNEPSYLPLIGQRTAIIRGCKEALVKEATSRNAHALFLSE